MSRVNLSHLGSLSTREDWRQRLSGGESQRLAMARLLVARPRLAFLDEATSALDQGNEKMLYRELLKRRTTFLSVKTITIHVSNRNTISRILSTGIVYDCLNVISTVFRSQRGAL